MRHFTEQQIREALDGTFTRVANYRAPRRQRNPERPFVKLTPREQRMRGKAWSDAETAVLLRMLKEGFTQGAIAAELGRGFNIVNKRVRELRKARRIE